MMPCTYLVWLMVVGQTPTAASPSSSPPLSSSSSSSSSLASLGSDAPGAAGDEAAATTLTWLEALDHGVRQNQGLLVERFSRDRLALGVPQAWAVWSPSVFLDGAYRRPQQVTTTVVDNRFIDDRAAYRLGVSWRNVIGTRLEASVGVDQGLGGGLSQPTVAVALEQPLLQGGFIDGAGLRVTEAEFQRAIQREVFRHTINTFIADLDAAYWDTSLAQADVVIKRRSRDRAQKQFDETTENIRRGILASTEIYVVEESLVIFAAELRRAEQRLLLAARALQQTLFGDVHAAPRASDDLTAIDLTIVVPPAGEAADVAIREHPLIRAQRLRVELAQAQARTAFNGVLPALTVRSSVGVIAADPNYGTAWKTLVEEPSVTAEVGARLSIPLDRSAVHAGLHAAEINVAQANAELARVTQQVVFGVENARSQLATEVALFESVTRQQTLAEQKLSAQLDKYQSGLSTLQDVVRFQRELDEAMSGVQRVARNVRTGRVRLLAAVGTLHDDIGVSIARDVVNSDVAGGR
jgi:outer membrane protein TolC